MVDVGETIELAPGRFWRHKKTGRLYRIVCEALIEATLEPAIVYKHVGGDEKCWIRPKAEFFDRFEYQRPRAG